jgi:eukaryotic-like serine/threonine-protein kinase
MQPPSPEVSTCPKCGGVLEKTPSGGLGCIPCLLRARIASQEETVHDPTPDGLEGGRRFGVYEIDCREDGRLYELGRGAMGVTYRATDTTLQRKVALKIIKTDIAERSADARERFMREARAAAALRHENIATVHQFGTRLETGQYFYAMELIEGETLDERVRRAGPLDARTTIQIAQQVTSALAAAEKQGLVHRDLKPANLMLVSPDGETSNNKKVLVKIIDFGLAKAINTATDPKSLTHDRFVGTPAFASPEQFEHAALDVRSDIYSLGETLWFALTGKTPFSGRTVEDIRRAQKSDVLPVEQLKSAHVPHRLKSLLGSMLAFEPASRPGTDELAARLKRCSPELRSVRRTRFGLAATSLMVFGMSAAIMFLWIRTRNSVSNLEVREKSIAVLPFENRSEDKANAYFADGIQDEILTRLSKIADLKVISRTSTQQYQSKPANLREIAKQLGVANILEGSVQKSGDAVRVNVQLIKAANDSHLWADTFDRKLTDIFFVESEVAKAIADTLKAKLSSAEQQLIAARPTSDPTAYELYLKGRVLWGKRGGDNIRQAIAFYEQAIVRDPTYAHAYAGLAEAYVILPIYTDASAREAYAKGKAAALKGLQLDDKLAEAHNALALVLFVYLDFAGSIAEFQRAIALNPNYATAHHWYGFNPLCTLGRFDEAIAESKRAVELDPLSPVINSDLGSNLMVARRYDEAIAQLRKTLEIDPTFSLAHGALGEALQFKGDLPGAIVEYTKAQELAADPRSRVLMAAAKAQLGDKDAAVRMLAELEEASRHREIPGVQRAVLYTSLGNRTEAIRCLEQSVADHDTQDVAWLKVYPTWDPLRGDPRFEALVQKVVGPGHK